MKTRIALLQGAPQTTFVERRRQIHSWIKEAEKNESDFICFPEGFLTGYYPERESAFENSFSVSDNSFLKWIEELEPFKATVIIGFNEREENRLYDSAAIIEQGSLIGIQRKQNVYHNYFTQGSNFSSFQSKGITFGIAICRDMNFIEPSKILASKGAFLLFSPMCNRVPIGHKYAKRPSYYQHFRARSAENKCWVASADWVWPDDKSLICPGHTAIYDPEGKEVARSHEGQEHLLIYDIFHK